EYLEMMPRIAVGPKRDHGLQRRTAWQSAGNFADEDRGVLRQLEARTRPLFHPLEGFRAFGTLAKGAQHVRPLYRCCRASPRRLSFRPHQKHLSPSLSIHASAPAHAYMKTSLTDPGAVLDCARH